MSYSDFYVKIY